MKSKIKFGIVVLIGLLLAAVLNLTGCFLNEPCPGNGQCTVTIGQGASGLYIDTDYPRSSCGKSATYSSQSGNYSGGCRVQNQIDNRNRRYGTQTCDCDS